VSLDSFSTARAMRSGLRARTLSAVELTELHIARIEAHDGALNAIPVRTFDRARAAAVEADRRLARGEDAPLLGLPMTLKESTQVAGLPQSAGLPAFAAHRPALDGPVARAVFAAGAGLLGKTNVPEALADWQADSPVYGRTVNPWDASRTPGGSTGGGGAALAAGLTPLEIGSDIGGSIRVPAAFCGVFGHRPSETAVPRAGAFPLADGPSPLSLMGVQGPLARSAGDLELLLDVIAGPEVGEDAAWRLALPPPRAERLGEFRVAFLPPPLDAQPSRAMQQRLDELAARLRAEGATVAEALPALDLAAYFADYQRLLFAMIHGARPRPEREALAAALREAGDPASLAQAEGLLLDASELAQLAGRREGARAAWRAFFRDWDVAVAPTLLDAAFPHQEGDFATRTLEVDDRVVPYGHNLLYPMLAIFPGLPATAFPAGLDPRGLPLGLQAIGPYLEDRTTLTFARLLEEQAGYGFEPPPGWA
jgi:amidase